MKEKSLSEKEIESLVKSYAGGNKRAFEKLHPNILTVINMVMSNKRKYFSPNDKDDVAQDLWIHAMRRVIYWEPTRGSFKNFLYSCLENKLINFVRKNERSFGKTVGFDVDEFDRMSMDVMSLDEEEDLIDFIGSSQLDELEVYVSTRFLDFPEIYLLRRVCTSLYMKTFYRSKSMIIAEFKGATGMTSERIRFLIDYFLVAIRMAVWEEGCRKGYALT